MTVTDLVRMLSIRAGPKLVLVQFYVFLVVSFYVIIITQLTELL